MFTWLLCLQVTLSSPPTTVLSCCSRRQALASTRVQLMKKNKTVAMSLENLVLMFTCAFHLPLDAPMLSQKQFVTSAPFIGSHCPSDLRSRARATSHLQSRHQRGRFRAFGCIQAGEVRYCAVWHVVPARPLLRVSHQSTLVKPPADLNLSQNSSTEMRTSWLARPFMPAAGDR